MERELTDGEIALLKSVFGDSINYKTVLVKDNSPSNTDAVTFNNSISMPKDLYKSDYSSSDMNTKAWLVHEVAHIWQEQAKGISVFWSGIGSWISNGADYT